MSEAIPELEKVRSEIDRVDRGIVDLLIERSGLVGRAAVIKEAHGLAPLQPERFEQMVVSLQEHGLEAGLDPELIAELWHVIHEQSVASQEAGVMAEPG